ncbi:hypothetical protein [Segatella copri]|uniref:hypothetical protein n=1 Tax=Segatella copri TaxID=165179 RepID=UPI0019331CBC|nr:hypothetical protein [Segatella copri]MBM0130998.1 hypothetical protein [Segatella copri]
MADIKMDFNGDVSIEKMFDIHDNQQVTIYNNSNTGQKENPNNPQEEIAKENINFPSNVFCITELHQTYWKEFCDAYYSSLGLLPNENSTYEQKYETFCQLQGKQTERNDYTENGLTVKEEDFKFLKFLEKRLYTLKEREELISTLYYYVRTIWSVRRKIKNDIWVIRNINPYCTKADYSQYILDETKRFSERDGYWPIIRDVLKYHMNEEMLKEMLGDYPFFEHTRDDTLIETIEETGETFKYNPAEGSVIFLVNEILEATIQGFNTDLHELTTLLSENNKCTDGKEQKFFLYRFFMSYESSLPEIKNMLEELPSPRNLNRLQKEHNRLISTFSKTPLGNQWIQCMEYEDGIKHVAKYFMNKKNNLTMEEKSQFFYTLDKICIIEEILNGNAQKYGLKVDYPEDWFATEKGTKNVNVSEEVIIPQNCKEAINNVFTDTFKFSDKKVELNSRIQIAKAAHLINLKRNYEVAILMYISMEINAILPGVRCIDFIRALIGIGVVKYSDDNAIITMSNGMSKKMKRLKEEKVSSNHADYLLWKNKDKKIGEKIYKAMTTEEV